MAVEYVHIEPHMDMADALIESEVSSDFDDKKNVYVLPKRTQKRKAKPKVTLIWPPEDIRRLIITVEMHRCLWDFGCAEHKSMIKREAAWKEVNRVLDFRYDIPECKAKWSNVKTAFQKVQAKMQAIKSEEPNSRTIPTWAYWIEMQFLTKNDGTNNVVSASNLSFDEIESSSSNQFEPMPETACSSHFSKNKSFPQLKRKYVESPPPAPSRSFPSQEIERALKIMRKNEQDEWQIFGNYLANQMRKISAKSHDKANRLQRQLTRAVLDMLDELYDSS